MVPWRYSQDGNTPGGWSAEDLIAYSDVFGGTGVAGRLDGLLVVDVDVKHGATLERTCDVLGITKSLLKATQHVTTPSGGHHLYFRVLPGQTYRRTIGLLPGVDLLTGQESVAMLPGSSGRQGRYQWKNQTSPVSLPEEPQRRLAEVLADRPEGGWTSDMPRTQGKVSAFEQGQPVLEGSRTVTLLMESRRILELHYPKGTTRYGQARRPRYWRLADVDMELFERALRDVNELVGAEEADFRKILGGIIKQQARAKSFDGTSAKGMCITCKMRHSCSGKVIGWTSSFREERLWIHGPGSRHTLAIEKAC
jgi:hypothetical protein